MDPVAVLSEVMYREVGDTNSDWLCGRRGAVAVAEQIDALIKQRIAEALTALKQECKPKCAG